MVRPTESPWSATKRDIHTAISRTLAEGEDAALATVVAVDGSRYRRPGAKMVVSADGEMQGAVTAGCLEDSVTDLARETIVEATPRTKTYDLTDDDTDAWGLGLGCNGIIDIFIEPIDESFVPVAAELDERRGPTVLTAVSSTDARVSVGDRTVLTERGQQSTGRDRIPEDVVRVTTDRTGAPSTDESVPVTVNTDDGEVRVFVDRIDPSPELLLFGGQEDVNPVASLAR